MIPKAPMVGGYLESLCSFHRHPPAPPAAPTGLDARVRWVETRRVRFRVLDTGEGPTTVVIAPDPPNAIEHHVALIDELARSARVVCFDLPCFGLSHASTPVFGFTTAEHAQAMLELLDALAVRRATLAFCCLASYVGLVMARQRPDVIERLVLSQAPGWADAVRWAKRFDYFGLVSTAGVGQLLVRAVRDRITRAWYPAALPQGADPQPYIDAAIAVQRRGGSYPLASAVQALYRFDESLVRGLAQETIVLWGTRDRTHAASTPGSFRELVPHARVIELDRCGHFPDLEAPELWRELVLRPPHAARG